VLDEAPIALLGGREELAAPLQLLLGLRAIVHPGGRAHVVARPAEASHGREQENADEVPQSHDPG